MHHRILSWLCCFALAAIVSLHAQTPAAPAGAAVAAAPMPPGLVLAAKVTGTVTMTVNAVVTPIKVDISVPQNAKITTAANSSVVLVFSNGATTQLGPNTELVIEEFLQDPFATSQKVSDMTDEPSVSRTKLALNRGELVGNVKKLKHDKGSTFTVQTPVGAAGIRGTTFRIVFVPSGNGLAFNFQLSTVEGSVAFAQPGVGGTPGTPATTTTTTANASGTATVAPGVAVPQGQEISLTVNVTQNAQGVLVVTVLPPPVTTTVPISTTTMQAVTQVAQEISVAVQNAVFTPAPVAPPAAGGAGGGADPGGNGGAKTENTTTSGTTTGTTTTTITTTGATTTTTTTTTSTITAPNFTAQVEATTTTTSPAVTQPPRIVTNPNGNPGG